MESSDVQVVGLSNSKPKSKTNWKVLGAIIGIVVLAVGVVAGIFLVKDQQNISEKAASSQCPGAEQCPMVGNPDHLLSCHPGESDGTPSDSLCSAGFKLRLEICGTQCYECNGSSWVVTTLSKCSATATAKATATATATSTSAATATSTSTSKSTATSTSTSKSTATSTSTSKATATAKASSTATAVPIPVTGVEWPTMLGAGFGVVMILVSLGLAL